MAQETETTMELLPETEAALKPAAGTWSVKDRVSLVVLGLLGAVFTIMAMLPGTSNIDRGALLLGLMLVLLMMNVNIGVAMTVSGLLGILFIAGPAGTVNMLTEVPFGNTASFSLSVLPMFVLMGLLLWRSGLTSDLYAAARAWLSWLPGGLAITTNIAGAGLGAASGSTMGITYAVGRIGIPEMIRAGYDTRLAVGSVASAGTIGQLIPPSILLVVYATFAEVPVGPQLMAGLVPGLLLTLGYMLVVLGIATIWPKTAPRPSSDDAPTWKNRWSTLVAIWPLVLLIAVVIGGMYIGWFTPTESGAVGAVGAFILAIWRLRRGEVRPAMSKALTDTVASVGAIMFLLIGAALLNRMLSLTGLARWFAELLGDAGLGLVPFILMLIVIFLVLGMFMEPMAMILIVVPILLPVVQEMGFSALWFGVFVVLMAEVGLLTPPVGMLAFLVHRIAQDKDVNLGRTISIGNVFVGVMIFVPAAIIVVLLISLVPEIVEFLPQSMNQ